MATIESTIVVKDDDFSKMATIESTIVVKDDDFSK